MKKILLIIITFFIILSCVLTINKNDNKSTYKTVTLAEVTHSIFYAPLYVAIENNYFEDEGIKVNLILTSGADKVSAAVLSDDADIGFAGAESAIYVYQGGEKDYLKIFSGLTKRDGQFIIGRKNQKSFELKDLIGKEILVGRKGGMPAINFINALKNENIDPKLVKINYQIDFASLSGAFIGNTGDYVNLFEPNATLISKNQDAYILTSIGKYSGEMPYTTFYARKSYIEKNPKVIKAFEKAIDKGLEFVKNNDSKTIANVIYKQFPDNSINDLSTMIDNYKKADSWLDSSIISKESFDNLQGVLIENKLLSNEIEYKKLVLNLIHNEENN